MLICDMHTHSNNSFDAKNSVDEMCAAALKRGVGVIAVTDHCEAPSIGLGEECEFGCFDELIPQSIRDAQAAKLKYDGELRVLTGLEFGEPEHEPELTRRALGYGEYDFVLASVHNIRSFRDFYYLDFSSVKVDEVLKLYFDELIETALFPHFDSLAHITYPLRYIKSRLGFVPDLSPYSAQIDEIFKILIKNNKSLEINVSGLFKELGTTLPDFDLIKRYRELGGRLITIGTDAHSVDFVGRGIEQGIEVAKRAGFGEYAYYIAHEPIMIQFSD
ncbi:MAG: histidinol-phosphatase HisJ family protein [Ruminococcus sp.]|nr:histidinol-phosphatase HisJ family protein [Ruminococcus sp.]